MIIGLRNGKTATYNTALLLTQFTSKTIRYVWLLCADEDTLLAAPKEYEKNLVVLYRRGTNVTALTQLAPTSTVLLWFPVSAPAPAEYKLLPGYEAPTGEAGRERVLL